MDNVKKKNDELEEKMKKVKEENYLLKDELEEEMKKVKEENDLLKDELNQSIIERNTHVKKIEFEKCLKVLQNPLSLFFTYPGTKPRK